MPYESTTVTNGCTRDINNFSDNIPRFVKILYIQHMIYFTVYVTSNVRKRDLYSIYMEQIMKILHDYIITINP